MEFPVSSNGAFDKWNGKTTRLKKSKPQFLNSDMLYLYHGGTSSGISISTNCCRINFSNKKSNAVTYFFTEIDKILDIYDCILNGNYTIIVKNMNTKDLLDLFHKNGKFLGKKYIKNKKLFCYKFDVSPTHLISLNKSGKIMEEPIENDEYKGITFKYIVCVINDNSFYHDTSHSFPYSTFKQEMRWSPEWWFNSWGRYDIFEAIVSDNKPHKKSDKINKNNNLTRDISEQSDLYFYDEDTNDVIYKLYDISEKIDID